MRGKKAKRLRCEAAARGEKRTRRLNCKAQPGPSRAMRRMEKFQPQRYADLELENDPAARRLHIRRWCFIFSKKARDAADVLTKGKQQESEVDTI